VGEVNQLLIAASDFLSGGNFDYAICGGFALDLFTGKNWRVHSDIDVCVFENDKGAIFQHMKEHHWTIYEFQGRGIVRLVNSVSECTDGRNLMCLKGSCELVQFSPYKRKRNLFSHEFFHTGIQELNYLEFLFNTSTSREFVFDSKAGIYREMNKAFLSNQGIPYLSPELALLYKAKSAEREENQFDYAQAITEMDNEQVSWFHKSLDILYPRGHAWRK